MLGAWAAQHFLQKRVCACTCAVGPGWAVSACQGSGGCTCPSWSKQVQGTGPGPAGVTSIDGTHPVRDLVPKPRWGSCVSAVIRWSAACHQGSPVRTKKRITRRSGFPCTPPCSEAKLLQIPPTRNHLPTADTVGFTLPRNEIPAPRLMRRAPHFTPLVTWPQGLKPQPFQTVRKKNVHTTNSQQLNTTSDRIFLEFDLSR